MGSCSSRNSNSVAKNNFSPPPASSKTDNNSNKHSKPSSRDDEGDTLPSIIKYKSEQVSPINSFRRLGGSEEEMTFFDSKAYMDSDCESDFYSVNGDFTPSGGCTPVHPKIQAAAAQILNNDSSTTSPTAKKNNNKLVDLFRDSIRIDNNNNNGSFQEKLQPVVASKILQESSGNAKQSEMEEDCVVKSGSSSSRRSQCCGGGFSRLVSVRGLKKSCITPSSSSTPSHQHNAQPISC